MRRRERHPLAGLLWAALLAAGLFGLWRLGARFWQPDSAVTAPVVPAMVPTDLTAVFGTFEVLRLVNDLNGDGAADVVAISPHRDGARRVALVLTEGDRYRLAGTALPLQWPGVMPELSLTDLPGAPGSLLVKSVLPGGEEQFQAFRLNAAQGLMPLDYYRLVAPERSERSLVLVSRRLNVLYYYQNGKVAMAVRVATGKDRHGPPAVDNNYTPEGRFRIMVFKRNPSYTTPDGSGSWQGGDPKNPLGTRWLGFPVLPDDTGWIFGIHGTHEPDSLGTWSTNGSIRMTNADVEKLFDLLQQGAPLEIQ